jgi:acetyl-CoA carboxylase biotin carboxyl carrier protein
MSMDTARIMELMDVAARAGLDELEIEEGGMLVRFARTADNAAPATALAPASAPPAAPAPSAAPVAATAKAVPRRTVVAPMVGTFYRALSPGAAPLVEAGALVEAGQPLGVLEAMKMMNQVEAEHTGRVVRICCEDGALAMAGQVLFEIEEA